MSKNKFLVKTSDLLLSYLVEHYKEDFFFLLESIYVLEEYELVVCRYNDFYDFYSELYEVFSGYNYHLLDICDYFLNLTIEEESYRHSHMFLCIRNTIEKIILKGELSYEYR